MRKLQPKYRWSHRRFHLEKKNRLADYWRTMESFFVKQHSVWRPFSNIRAAGILEFIKGKQWSESDLIKIKRTCPDVGSALDEVADTTNSADRESHRPTYRFNNIEGSQYGKEKR